MKLIQFKCLSFYNRLIAYLLGLMGFVSCSIPEPTEYGMPHATYKVKGTVKSQTTNLYIPNIKVYMQNDTTHTDGQGNFEIDFEGLAEDRTFAMQFIDVDGITNERYIEIDTTITFEDPVFTNGDGGWYRGETEKILLIKMNLLNEPK